MSENPRGAPPTSSRMDVTRLWQIIAAVLALLVLTLLVTTIALRSRADSAVADQTSAQARTAELEARNADLERRNEQLFTQLSASNERLLDVVGAVKVPARYARPSAKQVARAVTAQERARTQAAKDRARLRNAQLCAGGALRSLERIHAGADIESGSGDAVDLLGIVQPACQAAME